MTATFLVECSRSEEYVAGLPVPGTRLKGVEVFYVANKHLDPGQKQFMLNLVNRSTNKLAYCHGFVKGSAPYGKMTCLRTTRSSLYFLMTSLDTGPLQTHWAIAGQKVPCLKKLYNAIKIWAFGRFLLQIPECKR